MDKFNIRVHYGRDQYMITDVDHTRYSHSKLLTDINEVVLANVLNENTLFFTMLAYIEDCFDVIDICSDGSVKMMFDRNMKHKEVDIHLNTDDVEVLAVDKSSRKKLRKMRESDFPDIDVDYEPPTQVETDIPE